MNKSIENIWHIFKDEADECEYLINVNERIYTYLRIVDMKLVLGKSFEVGRYNVMVGNVDVASISESFRNDIFEDYDDLDVDDFVLAAEYGREHIPVKENLDKLEDVISWIRNNLEYNIEFIVNNIMNVMS